MHSFWTVCAFTRAGDVVDAFLHGVESNRGVGPVSNKPLYEDGDESSELERRWAQNPASRSTRPRYCPERDKSNHHVPRSGPCAHLDRAPVPGERHLLEQGDLRELPDQVQQEGKDGD